MNRKEVEAFAKETAKHTLSDYFALPDLYLYIFYGVLCLSNQT